MEALVRRSPPAGTPRIRSRARRGWAGDVFFRGAAWPATADFLPHRSSGDRSAP